MVPLLKNTLTSLFVYNVGHNLNFGRSCIIPHRSGAISRMSMSARSAMLDTPQEINSPDDERSTDTKTWLVVGDGDLSYCASIAESVKSENTQLVATVLEEESVHNRVYEKSKQNSDLIASHTPHQVKFGIDGTKLQSFFPDTKFDCIEFNFPHWRGKTNARYNRELLDGFLKSAGSVLKDSGEIRVALCDGQGGMPADTLQEWRQSWMPAMYAAENGLMLSRLEPYVPEYGLSSHRGVDRAFHIGERPQRYIFTLPDDNNPVDASVQISCRHELRIMLHPDKMADAPVTHDELVHGDVVFELAKDFVPKGFRFEMPARDLLTPYKDDKSHVPLAVFLLNYSGDSAPLTRGSADSIRAEIEAEVIKRWGLGIAKAGRLVSRPYPYMLLSKLIKEYE